MRDILLIDNFDSFTYNLVEDLSCLGAKVEVQRNDRPLEFLLQRLQQMHDPLVVLSPGPGTPENAGVCIELIHAVKGRYPLLGICLGHQALTVAFGGVVDRAPKPLHGERSLVQLKPDALFEGLPAQVRVGRYHSLLATKLPNELNTIADVDELVMAIRHQQYALVGLQFHPESILSTHGRVMLGNALQTLKEKAA